MGLGSLFGGGSSKATSSVTIPKWLQKEVKPLYKESARVGMQIAQQPYQRYTGQRVARPGEQMAGNLRAAGDMPNAAIYGDAASMGKNIMGGSFDLGLNTDNYRKATGYTGDVLSGKYMSGNPYLQDVINKSSRGVTDTFNKTMLPQAQANLARQNAFGGSGWMQANRDMESDLAQQLADMESTLRYQDYGQERSYMDKAVSDAMAQQGMQTDIERANQAARLSGVNLGLECESARNAALRQALESGDYQRQLDQQQIDADYGDFQEERDWLFRALQGLQGGLGNVQGMYGRTQSGSGGGSNVLGNMAGAFGSLGQGYAAFGGG